MIINNFLDDFYLDTETFFSLNTIPRTISKGSDDGANNSMAKCFSCARHLTTKTAVKNIRNAKHKTNGCIGPYSIFLGGHGSAGYLETGAGQSGPSNSDNEIWFFNRNNWMKEFKSLRNEPGREIYIYSCYTGAEKSGADLLFEMAKITNKRILARTGLTMTVQKGDYYSIKFQKGSTWQVAEPKKKPKPIPKTKGSKVPKFSLIELMNELIKVDNILSFKFNLEYDLGLIDISAFANLPILSNPFNYKGGLLLKKSNSGSIFINGSRVDIELLDNTFLHIPSLNILCNINLTFLKNKPEAMSANKQTLISVGDPKFIKEDSTIIQNFDNIFEKQSLLAESKTFNVWNKNPWVIIATNNARLAEFNRTHVTLVKALDNNTNIEVVYATIYGDQKSLGYASDYLKMRIFFMNKNSGLLEEWNVTDDHDVRCQTDPFTFTYRATYRPDWFDLCDQVMIIFDRSTWKKC